MKYTIPVVTRYQDNGDGSWTTLAYNSEEDMLADHHLYDGYLSEKDRREILTEADPYNNGYIDTDFIEIEIINGVAKLAKNISFHAGQ